MVCLIANGRTGSSRLLFTTDFLQAVVTFWSRQMDRALNCAAMTEHSVWRYTCIRLNSSSYYKPLQNPIARFALLWSLVEGQKGTDPWCRSSESTNFENKPTFFSSPRVTSLSCNRRENPEVHFPDRRGGPT
ncbi:hypothetical protein MRX96_033585 [Rhipicephalus microplus]